MTPKTSLKFIAIGALAITFTSGIAVAGEGCKDKKHSAMTKTAAPAQTAVLPATTEKAQMATKKQMKPLTFDQALAKCQKYGAADLQACIDKKTGVAAKPKS